MVQVSNLSTGPQRPQSRALVVRTDPPPDPEIRTDAEPGPSLRRASLAGTIAVGIGFGGFFAWAFTASLDSAAMASGTVIVDSKKKTISHLEGGILKRVLVAEGEAVKAGQPLLELDDTRARSELAQLQGIRVGLLARVARLRAEQRDADAIDFPSDLTGDRSPIARAVMTDERALFEKRRRLIAGKLGVQRKQMDQFDAEARAAGAQSDAADRQRALMADQLDKVRSLATKGYATWRSATDLETQLSQVIGNAGQRSAERAKAEQGKAAAEIAVLSVEMDWQGSIAADIQDSQLKLNDTEQKIIQSSDVLARLVVRAPQDGAVLDLQVRTPGSSVAAGQKLLELVPESQPLVVEARLATRDIEAVRVGADTQVRLMAYGQRLLAPLAGRLTYVGADQSTDPQTGAVYYTIRASVLPESLARHPSVAMVPGMPADLVVNHKPRKAISYFIEPITASFARAFHEE